MIRRLFAWLWNRWHDRGPLTRRVNELDATQETIDLSGPPLKPHHRRRAWHDPRLLPKPRRRNPYEKPPRVMSHDEAKRLFGPTLRTGRRDLRTLTSDPDQLDRYGLPLWKSEADVAKALGISVSTLRHFSIHRMRERAPHYVTFAVPKRAGGERVLCAPKRRLKRVLRTLHETLIARLPVHDTAHGFVRGRSVASAAAPHTGRAVVVRVDLADFFATVTMPRVRGYLLAMGYGYPVAATLAVLMTEAPRQPVVIDDVVYHVPVGPRHCVQGAPTSPGLCNALVMRLDRRLDGLARYHDAAYTRYADDLTFSLDDEARVGRLFGGIRRIVADEGFAVNEAKTRVMRRGSAQRVCGVTVNEQLGLSRRERRQIRALIHQEGLRRAAGEADESVAAKIEGWLAYLGMLNPAQAAPLRRAWEAVREA